MFAFFRGVPLISGIAQWHHKYSWMGWSIKTKQKQKTKQKTCIKKPGSVNDIYRYL